MPDKLAIDPSPCFPDLMKIKVAQALNISGRQAGRQPAYRTAGPYPAVLLAAVGLLLVLAVCGDSQAADAGHWKTMEVTATSFTLAPDETKAHDVGVSASGHVLKPRSKAIAVSRDLLKKGLSFGTKVKIENLPGTYTVRDKMHRRWRKKIDILFAKKKRALEFGRKTVTIRYRVADAN
ncbi:MAG: hypothetical protein PF501_06325 [Salinisphaera sp.]|jgi:3D (Asp-Asp-Asp) domain-containing protein|nr:hypothetical protein [Salinisphaera sp.]